MVTKQNLGQWNLFVAVNILYDYREVGCVLLFATWFVDGKTLIFLSKDETEA